MSGPVAVAVGPSCSSGRPAAPFRTVEPFPHRGGRLGLIGLLLPFLRAQQSSLAAGGGDDRPRLGRDHLPRRSLGPVDIGDNAI